MRTRSSPEHGVAPGREAPPRRRAWLLWVVPALVGCNPVGVRHSDDAFWFRRAQRTGLTGATASLHTTQLLAQRGLERVSGARATLEQLIAELAKQPDRDLAAAIAELAYLQADALPPASPDAGPLYATAVVGSYAFLFDGALGEPASPFDPMFRLASDIYNRSLAQVAATMKHPGTSWEGTTALPTLVGNVVVELRHSELAWHPDEYVDLHPVYGFEVHGVRNHFRSPGLGVPLLAIRDAEQGPPSSPAARFLPRDIIRAYPATLLLRLETSVSASARGDAPFRAVLELFDPSITTEVQLDGRRVPLETDMTTPLAYTLQNAPRVSPVEGLLDPAAWENYHGLFMLEPYRPGRIPVVFVHGLLSEPTGWLEVINELLGDATLRKRYQIWYFQYPTGNPVIYSAHLLREALRDIRATLDPDGRDAALDEMVLVGQSVGGLLCKLQAQGSDGESIWRAVSDMPLEAVPVDADQKQLLHDVFVFEPLPFVKRLVFIVTPHQGAPLADRWSARFFSSLVRLPAELERLITGIGGAIRSPERLTAITQLSPGSPLLQRILGLRIASDVEYHSIIANLAGNEPGGTDGIVPYASSHLDGAASELVVHATHGTARTKPRAILELRRILRSGLAGAGVTLGAPGHEREYGDGGHVR